MGSSQDTGQVSLKSREDIFSKKLSEHCQNWHYMAKEKDILTDSRYGMRFD